MNRFDVVAARAAVIDAVNDRSLRDDRWTIAIVSERFDAACAAVEELTRDIEATRKAPCRFDVVAARADLARIDAARTSGSDRNCVDAFHAARRLLDHALSAIDMGCPTPASDAANSSSPVAITDEMVDKAAARAWDTWDVRGSVSHVGQWLTQCLAVHEQRRREARAVLEYAASLGGVARAAPVVDVDRLRKEAATWERLAIERGEEICRLKSAVKAPVAITDAMVEEATIAGFAAATGSTLESFAMLSGRGRENLRASTRAVLKCAASLGGAKAAPGAESERWQKEAAEWERIADARGKEIRRLKDEALPVPAGKCAVDRLTDYRCAARIAFPLWLSADVENHAHSMLTAERSPTDAR